MSVLIKTNLSHPENYGNTRALTSIEYIVIHFTANDGDTDEANARYFKDIRNASAHRFVDDDSITISVPDNRIAWAVGGKKWSDCAQTGGGRLYGTCSNSNSISLELCDCNRNGKYDFTEATLKNAAWQVAEWMKSYDIDIDHVIRHFDVNGKHCPIPFMPPYEENWKAFKQRVLKTLGQTADLTSTVDKPLFEACRQLLLHKIISQDTFNLWKREDLMQLKLVPNLLAKMGGIDNLIKKQIITDEQLWRNQKYGTKHVRALIIKFAMTLE